LTRGQVDLNAHDSGREHLAAARYSGAPRAAWQAAVVDPSPPVLRAVISLAAQTATLGGPPACLVSLELWSTQIRLRLAYTDLDPHQTRQLQQASHGWRGWDDVGTQYQGRGGGGGGSQSLYIQDVALVPGPPNEAAVITLRGDHDGGSERLTIPLDGGHTER
jgi:hypothetical protein